MGVAIAVVAQAARNGTTDPVARWIALGALSVAIGGFLLNLRNAMKDRPKLRVGISAKHYMGKDKTTGADRVYDYLHVVVTNYGRRPTAVMSVDVETTHSGILGVYSKFAPPPGGIIEQPPPSSFREPIEEHRTANFYVRPITQPAWDWDPDDGIVDSIPVRARVSSLTGTVYSNWTPFLCRPTAPSDPRVLTEQIILLSRSADYLNHPRTWRFRKWRKAARQGRDADRARASFVEQQTRDAARDAQRLNDARRDELREFLVAEIASRPEGMRGLELLPILDDEGFDLGDAGVALEDLVDGGFLVSDGKQNPLLRVSSAGDTSQSEVVGTASPSDE